MADLSLRLLWAAACVGFFGFMRAGKFTMVDSRLKSADLSRDSNQPSPPSLHMQDVAVNSRTNPSAIRLHLRMSRLTQRARECLFFWGAQAPMCVRCQPSLHIWQCGHQGDSIYLCGRMANPCPGQSSDTCSRKHSRLLAWRPADTRATASVLVQQLLQQLQVS